MRFIFLEGESEQFKDHSSAQSRGAMLGTKGIALRGTERDCHTPSFGPGPGPAEERPLVIYEAG